MFVNIGNRQSKYKNQFINIKFFRQVIKRLILAILLLALPEIIVELVIKVMIDCALIRDERVLASILTEIFFLIGVFCMFLLGQSSTIKCTKGFNVILLLYAVCMTILRLLYFELTRGSITIIFSPLMNGLTFIFGVWYSKRYGRE